MKKRIPYIIIVVLLAVIGIMLVNPKVVVEEKEVTVPAETEVKEIIVEKLVLTSEPSGATVKINGENVGRTPYQLIWNDKNLDVMVSKEGYTVDTKVITSFSEQVNFKLKPLFAEVTFAIEPRGTEIWDGKRLLGQSPIAGLMLRRGSHKFIFRKEGLPEKSQLVILGSNRVITDNLDYSSEEYSKINLESNVTGAKVFLDNSKIGVTPLKIDYKPGDYKLEIVAEGYDDYSEEVTLAANESFSKDVELAPKPATLKINAYKSDIYIDGENTAKEKYEGKLPAGRYTIETKRDGYKSKKEIISLKNGQSYALYLSPNEMIKKEVQISQKVEPVKLKNPWTRRKNAGLVSSLLLTGGGLFFNQQMQSSQNDYNSALSNNDASSYRDDVESYESYRNSTYYLSLGTIGWSAYSWFKERAWDEKHNQGRK